MRPAGVSINRAGTLALNGGGTHTGTFTPAAPATLEFNGGTHVATAGSFGGTGTFAFRSGTVTIGGTAAYVATTTRVINGTAILNVNGDTAVFEQSAGYFGGAGTFTITGSATWSGGTWGEPGGSGGTIVIDPGVTVALTGSTTYSYLGYGRTLNNNGTIQYSAPSYYMMLYSTGTLNNAGTIEILTDQGFPVSGGTNALNNSGTLRKSAGTGTSAIGAPVNNSGIVKASGLSVAGGKISLSGGLIAQTGQHFTVNEFWRFWVVHLWVEDFLELFTTVMVAYMFVLLGVVREKVALTVIFLDIILYSVGGVIGTMHHLYFSGAPAENMALGAVFSALEGGSAWVIALSAAALALWMADLARRVLRTVGDGLHPGHDLGLPGQLVLGGRRSRRTDQGGHLAGQPARAATKVGRNDPCPCGSGKKYKHCHGRTAAA